MLALHSQLPQLVGFCRTNEDRSISGSWTRTKYVYDTENRLKTAGGVTYTYDGDGNRYFPTSGELSKLFRKKT
jgi:hypothetical protein